MLSNLFLQFKIFLPDVLCTIISYRGMKAAAFTYKTSVLSFSLRSAGAAFRSCSFGINLHKFYGIDSALILETFPDITVEAPRQFPIRSLCINLCLIFCNGCGNHNPCWFFYFNHLIDFGINESFGLFPHPLFLPVVLVLSPCPRFPHSAYMPHTLCGVPCSSYQASPSLGL